MKTKLILIEGLPGSGKTTVAEAISRKLAAQKVPSNWWREEDPEHPATPRVFRQRARMSDFVDRCIDRWIDFVAASKDTDPVRILEGSAFQSTIRFMLEYDVTLNAIIDYVRRFDGIVAPLKPCFIFLHLTDPVRFLTDGVYPDRGSAWVEKVSAYLSNTPCCRKRGWRGSEGMTQFWWLYQDLCEEAVDALTMPVLCLEVDRGSRQSVYNQIFSWLSAQHNDNT